MSDFPDASTQERFLMMMNERIGNIEETLYDLKAMVSNIAKFTTTDFITSFINLPRNVCKDIDTAFVKRIIIAVEKTRHVQVKTAWVIDHNPKSYDRAHSISIYLQLKEQVLLSSIYAEINANLRGEFEVGASYFQMWHSSSLVDINNVQPGGLAGVPTAIRVDT